MDTYLLGRHLLYLIPRSENCRVRGCACSVVIETASFPKWVNQFTLPRWCATYEGVNTWLSFLSQGFLKSSFCLFHFVPHTWGWHSWLPTSKKTPHTQSFESQIFSPLSFYFLLSSLVPFSPISWFCIPKMWERAWPEERALQEEVEVMEGRELEEQLNVWR